MERKQISDTLSVSSQINLNDVIFLKDEGVKTIICNRPDGEDPNQLEHDRICKEAIDNGMEFYFMPVISGQITPQDSDEFSKIITNTPKPIHAYCRSGTRCSILWALSELKLGVTRDSILEQASKSGYDLSNSI